MSGFPALDVLIGLAFVYFLLSLVTSALTETVAALFQLRFRTLQRGIRELIVDGDVDKKKLKALEDALNALPADYEHAFEIAQTRSLLTAENQTKLKDAGDKPKTLREILEGNELSLWDRFEKNPRLRALWKQTGFVTRIPVVGKRGPSYIPPRVFALTLLDTLAPSAGEDGHDVIKQAEAAAKNVENPLLKKWLQDALAEGRVNRNKLLSSLESSFDGVMDRVSGWYKRYSTIWVLVFAVLVAGAMNADSYAIGLRLWKDEAVRSAIVAQAGELSEATCPDGQSDDGQAPDSQQTKITLDQAAKCVNQLEELGLPFGWNAENRPDWTWQGVGSKAFGLIVTVFALMLGAPFWFDTLGKLARLRTTGKREGTLKSDESRRRRP